MPFDLVRGFIKGMKAFRYFLLAVVALAFAPRPASALIVSLPAELPGFHVVFISSNMLDYVTAEAPPGTQLGGTFDVSPNTPYNVQGRVGGVLVTIGTVVWDGVGNATYTPN